MSLVRLELFFSGDKDPELTRTRFFHPQYPEGIVCHRGKQAIDATSCGSFQWSPGVRALSAFLLKSISEVDYKLSGGQGTFAATLDYALSKQPRWLIEMFGVCKEGTTLARHCILRENAERKRPGPVVLKLRSGILSTSGITIFLNEVKIDNARFISKFADTLLVDTLCGDEQNLSDSNDRITIPEKDHIRDIISAETRCMLSATDVFTQRGLKKLQERLLKQRVFQSLLSKHKDSLSFLSKLPSNNERLGLFESAIPKGNARSDAPLKVAIPVSLPSSILLFLYLQKVNRIPISIEYSFPHAVDLVSQVVHEELPSSPDLLVVGAGPAATLLSSAKAKDFSPTMFMPQMSHSLLETAASKATRRPSRFGLLSESLSTASLWFSELNDVGLVSKSRTKICHMEPDETISELLQEESDFSGVLFFPYNQIAHSVSSSIRLRDTATLPNTKEAFLFSHKSLNEQRLRHVRAAIRNAWIELSHNQIAFKNTLDALMDDNKYIKTLSRYAGLDRLSTISANQKSQVHGKYATQCP